MRDTIDHSSSLYVYVLILFIASWACFRAIKTDRTKAKLRPRHRSKFGGWKSKLGACNDIIAGLNYFSTAD